MRYEDIFAQRVLSMCRKRGISVNKLANMCGIHQSTLDNIVRGISKNPRIMTLHKIANAFGMTVSEFLDFKELNDYSFEDEDD